ncbi:spore germination protein GerPB [Gracilibacillus alcaliphilus]|uniref:spore germination protein GerPB n=1 Tax=Gracilibacillus alcaliphilus TaxID=1401441 RepID=UPI00195A952C|nr:spore germination protein GerPB [Gracilibacillus alcaliphilus]MBM7675432.1 spore germination protein PB [Gracilibacillus alcaliphilus]
MILTVNQSIYIHFLKVGNISNSSVLQIGSTGKMQTMSQLYNTGGFTVPAETAAIEESATPLVPLSPF